MATIDEHPERYGWWINELESLGIADAKRSDELDNGDNDNKSELKDLAENTKEMMYQQARMKTRPRKTASTPIMPKSKKSKSVTNTKIRRSTKKK